MKYCISIDKGNIDDYVEHYFVLLCKVRNSRVKAKQIAIMEMLLAQMECEGVFIQNGPLGDSKGVFSFLFPKMNETKVMDKLKGIGYCSEFYLLDFDRAVYKSYTNRKSSKEMLWKGRRYSVTPFYLQDEEIYEQQSPHNRKFRIVGFDNSIRDVYGYRGDGSEYGRRALPVEDARCMVNLSIPSVNNTMIDPFAGGGGIVYQHRYIVPCGSVTSIDIEPALKPGLEYYGATHHVGNAKEIQLKGQNFDAVITEVPFSENAVMDIVDTLYHINTSVKSDGMFVFMCSHFQSKFIENCMREMGNHMLMNSQLNRKGTDVVLQVWTKSTYLAYELREFMKILSKIY